MSRVRFIGDEIDKTYTEIGKNFSNMHESFLSQNIVESQLERNKKQAKLREEKLNQYEKTLNGTRRSISKQYSDFQNKKTAFDTKINQEEYDLNLLFLNLLERETYIDSKTQVLNANIEKLPYGVYA